ncbi:hypothetical protein F511_11159 [Dorcoceras hygrometricum]|nr:hypothetical protein F511_11159 [Dorcoceras hygrometricum]
MFMTMHVLICAPHGFDPFCMASVHGLLEESWLMVKWFMVVLGVAFRGSKWWNCGRTNGLMSHTAQCVFVRVACVSFPEFVLLRESSVGAVVGLVRTACTWGLSIRKGSGSCGRRRENERENLQVVAKAQYGCRKGSGSGGRSRDNEGNNRRLVAAAACAGECILGCESEWQYRTLISLLGSLATMRRVVNYHTSWARQRKVELFDASGIRGAQSSQSSQSAYQPQQQQQPQVSQQSGRQRFRPRGQQFKKKSGSGSSGSGSSSSSGSWAEFCGFCGGKHLSMQCVGVQGSSNLCGQYGHFARVCSSAGS